MTLPRHILCVLVCVLAVSANRADGQDEPADAKPLKIKPTDVKPATAEDGTGDAQPSTEDDDDERLLRKLSDEPEPDAGKPNANDANDAKKEAAAAAAENPLEHAVAGMRSARERLEQGRTDDKTRALQEDVVRDLQKLIELAEQAQKRRQQSQSSSNQSNSQNRPQSDSSSSDQQDQSAAGASAGEPQGAPGSRNERANESRDAAREGTGGGVEQDRDSLFQGVWGHLPPAMRQRLLNMDDGKYLEKYSDLRRLYFKALAGQNQRER